MQKKPWFTILILLLATPAASQYRLGNPHVRINHKDVEPGKTRIEVVNIRSTKPVYTVVLEEVYTTHYHPYEFHNGNLYVIRRTGGHDGYRRFPNTWTDALWRYDKNKNGVMIYAVRGLDFRISPNGKYNLITSGDSLLFLNFQGQRMQGLSSGQFDLDGFDNMYLTNDHFFASNGGPGASFDVLLKINLRDFSWSRQELPGLPFAIDYAFNPFSEKIVCSDYPWLVDSESHEGWVATKPTVKLYLYDCRSKVKSILATSIAKQFHPQWVDTTHIEIDDPRSSKRKVIKIKR